MSLPTTSTVSRPKALGYSFRLDDLYLRGSVAPDRPLDITTAPLEAQKVNTASSSEDLRNEFGAIFSRTSFVGGEGLDFAHQRDLPEDAVSRFWDSKHIDITNPSPGEPAHITLLPAPANIETSSDSNLHLLWDGTRLHMSEGNTTRRSTDPTVTTPTFAGSDPHAGDAAASVLDLTTLGNVGYAALGANGIHKMTGGTWASLSTVATQKVWGVKLLLLASTGSTLDEVNLSTGTHTVRVTFPAGVEPLDAKDCGQAILVPASDGNIYALANNDSAVLTLQAQTPMHAGEIPYTVGSDGRFVFVATREATPSGAIGRVYRMEWDGYSLTNAQLLRQYGDQSATIDHAPRQIVANRKGVVWGVYETDGSFLWRYDSASGGVSRYLDLGASGLVVDILSISGRLFATVAGHGLRREQIGTYESDGYLIGPLGDLFSASQKSWAGALLDHDPITTDERVELYYTTDPSALTDPDSSSWVRVKNITSGHDTEETPLRGVDSRFLAGMVRLYSSSSAAVAPEVRGFAFRSYPGPGDVEVAMAVNTSDLVTRPGRRSIRSRSHGQDVYAALKNKEGRAAELEVLATGETFRGVVKQVSTRIPDEVERGTASVVTMVTFRGRRVSAADTGSTSTATFGAAMFGTALFGGAEEAA